MSTKPLTHAEWDTNGTNLTPTSAGHKSDGWANNEVPTAGEFNHWMNQVSIWTKWLYDGDCAFNNLSAAGTLGVTGATTLSGNLGVGGNTTMSGTLGVAGAAEIDGTLHVISPTTMDDSLSVDGDVTVTGDFKHGDRVFVQGFENLGYSSGATRTYSGGAHYVSLDAGGSMWLGLVPPMLVGKHRLKSFRIAMQNNSIPTVELRHQALSPQPVTTSYTLAGSAWTETEISNNGTDMVREYVLDSAVGLSTDDMSGRLVLGITNISGTAMYYYQVSLTYESVP